MSLDKEKAQLLGDTIDEWRCPACGRLCYTLKSQEALMVRCASCPGVVWMQHVNGEQEAT